MSYVLLLFYVYVNWFFILLFSYSIYFFFFFFFQAEDGIRDKLVTGVQTCALPILTPGSYQLYSLGAQVPAARPAPGVPPPPPPPPLMTMTAVEVGNEDVENRSEERRVGKECRSRWSP